MEQSQSQGNGETDSPVKMPGGKRVLSDSSPSMDSLFSVDSSQVRIVTDLCANKSLVFVRMAAAQFRVLRR